jgi:hypothetical protein
MARPPAPELTDRELEVMHAYWKHGELTLRDGGKSDADSRGEGIS